MPRSVTVEHLVGMAFEQLRKLGLDI